MTTAQDARGGRITLCLTGDVMTGRGVDQLFARTSSPALFEPFVRDAREYVALAERRNGRITRPVAHAYIWGDALDEWQRVAPAARIINLETSITSSNDHDRDKRFTTGCILTTWQPRAASIDVCVLANNHVLD
jgi:poly-gamma-glutamate synthesis protein (capsule biosynthesis protein)